MYIEVMNSQISLGYWAKCKGESFVQWPTFTLLNARRFTFTQIPSYTNLSHDHVYCIYFPLDFG